MQYDVLADVSDSETVPHLSLNVAARREAVIDETSFFARGQRAFKLVLKSIKEEEGGGREERRRKEKEEERKKKCEKENMRPMKREEVVMRMAKSPRECARAAGWMREIEARG